MMDAKQTVDLLAHICGTLVLPILLIGTLAWLAYLVGWGSGARHKIENAPVIQVTNYVLENGKIASFDPRLPGIFLLLDPKNNNIERWRYGTQAGFLESISTTKALKILQDASSEQRPMDKEEAK